MKNYIAEHESGRNIDPISGTTPNGVWRELEAATHKTRDELRAIGWKVMLDDGLRPPAPTPVLELTKNMIVEEPARNYRGLLIMLGVVVVFWILVYFLFFRG